MLPHTELIEILGLRVLIARAANADALRWWDDEALSESGLALAGRLFPHRPRRSVVQLALRAACNRHAVALQHVADAVHLFDLGGALELRLSDVVQSTDLAIPGTISDPARLAPVLTERGVDPVSRRQVPDTRLIEVDATADPLRQARLLAAAYVLGEVGRPVFPFARAGSAEVR